MNGCVYECMHAYIHTYIHTYLHTYTIVYIYIDRYICIHGAHTYTHTRTCVHAYIQAHVHTHTDTYIYIDIYIDATLPPPPPRIRTLSVHTQLCSSKVLLQPKRKTQKTETPGGVA